MQILQEEEYNLLIPENWREAFKLSFQRKSIHCRNCGLEGCKPWKHEGYSHSENQMEAGEECLYETPVEKEMEMM